MPTAGEGKQEATLARGEVGFLAEAHRLVEAPQLAQRDQRGDRWVGGAVVGDDLHPTADQRSLYTWLLEHGGEVLTGDSFFHLSAHGEAAARAEPLRGRSPVGGGLSI